MITEKIEQKFYQHLPPEQRRKIRELMMQQRTNFITQRDLIDSSILKVLRERISLTEQVLKNEVSLQHYVKRQEYLGKHLTAFFENMGGKDGK